MSVSEACKEYGISPSIYYKWQSRFFAGVMKGLESKRFKCQTQLERKNEKLESRLSELKSYMADLITSSILV